MKLKCQCCGIEQEFKDGEEAFKEGWDAPPHFTGVDYVLDGTRFVCLAELEYKDFDL